MRGMATQIEDVLSGTVNPVIPNLQVVAIGPEANPTTPSIDIFGGDPFTTHVGMGEVREFLFVVRARVSTADQSGQLELLYTMMDPRAATSVAGAILSDATLGNLIEDLAVASPEGPTGPGTYRVTGIDGDLWGCSWQVRVLP